MDPQFFVGTLQSLLEGDPLEKIGNASHSILGSLLGLPPPPEGMVTREFVNMPNLDREDEIGIHRNLLRNKLRATGTIAPYSLTADEYTFRREEPRSSLNYVLGSQLPIGPHRTTGGDDRREALRDIYRK